jgi:DNA ligase-associated metallophosphoesterase
MRIGSDPGFGTATPTAPFGCAALRVAGVDLVLMAEGVCFWPEESLAVVADLHLEKGSSAARRGTLLPPYDTAATLAALTAALARIRPRRVISLGDAFHDRFALERLSERDRAHIASLQAGRDWIWIAGNHDAGLVGATEAIGGRVAEEVAIGPLVFRHEPAPGAAPGEIAGHLHPAARVAAGPRAVRRRCFATDGDRLLMPAFGAYTGGLDVLDRAIRSLFDRTRLAVHLLGDGRVYSFPGRALVGRG